MFETLGIGYLKKFNNDFSKCENKWMKMSEDEAKMEFEISYDISKQFENEPREYCIWENAIVELDKGKALSLPMFYIRKATENKKCPKCGSSILDTGALSRHDNKTKICSDCGTFEALNGFSIKQY